MFDSYFAFLPSLFRFLRLAHNSPRFLFAASILVCRFIDSHFFTCLFYFKHIVKIKLTQATIEATAANRQDHFAETQALNIISLCSV